MKDKTENIVMKIAPFVATIITLAIIALIIYFKWNAVVDCVAGKECRLGNGL